MVIGKYRNRFFFGLSGLWLISENLRISNYACVSTIDSVYVIGGYTNGSPPLLNIIAEFKKGNWENIGAFAQPRASPASIISEGTVMIVGGEPYGLFENRR